MPVKTGVDGFVQDAAGSSPICDINSWEFSYSSNNQVYGSSCTSGHASAAKGRLGGTVTIEAWLNTDDEAYDAMKPGALITLWLYEDATRRWIVPVRISDGGVNTTIGEAGITVINITANTNGAWTYPDGTQSS